MKVAIVARAPSSRYLAPYQDDSWEIWSLSPQAAPVFSDLPRWDRWHELHCLNEKEAENPGYIAWLSQFGSKVWLREPHPSCPGANVYPRDAIFEECQKGWVNPFRFYNNSVALMIAHAIQEGVEELGIYGTDMCQVSEYGTQKPSCEALLGYAAGRGIKVTVPVECDLLQCQRIYGLDPLTSWERKITVHEKELEDRVKRLHNDLNKHKSQCVGAAAAHGEIRDMVEHLNGQAREELAQIVTSKCKRLEAINVENKTAADEMETQIKLTTGALEEIRYQKQFNL